MKKGLGLLFIFFLILSLIVPACAPAAPAPEKPAATKAPESKPAAEKPAVEKAAAPKPADKPAAAKPADRPPVKIGYLASATGTFAAGGKDMKDGFLLYLEQKGGQFAGRKVEVIAEDDEGKPDVGLTKAKKLVELDKVHMLGGIISSAVGYAVADYAKGQKIPLLINNAGSDDITMRQASPYTFRSSYSTGQYHYPLGDWAYKKGYRKAGLLASDYAPGYDSVGAFARTFTAAGGTIVQELYPALASPDPSPFITTLKPDLDVLYAFQVGAEGVRFLQRWSEYGMKGKLPLIGGNGLTDDTVLPEVKDAALGIVTITTWTPALETPENKAFVDAFSKKHNRIASFYAEQGYGGAMVIEKALQIAQGNIEDRDAFMKALEQVEVPNSPKGPMKFDKYHNVVVNVYLTEVRKVGSAYVNYPIETFKDVSQFWKWSPEEFMKMPSYSDMKGKWAK